VEGFRGIIKVKGRVTGAKTVTVTKNGILTALTKPLDFMPAIVEVDGDKSVPRYVWHPFKGEPDFGVTSVNYDLADLLAKQRYLCRQDHIDHDIVYKRYIDGGYV